MFDRIAGRYDLMNTLMTFGQDARWRQHVARLAGLPPGGRLLDVGSGTGGIALAARRRDSGVRSVAADFSLEMMAAGRQRPGGDRVAWCGADAQHLPFRDASFDAVTSGYLLRNVADAGQALAEQVRVVRPGGRVVCLDTCPQASSLARLFMRHMIPLLGRLVAGEARAYRYLPQSTQAFLAPEALAAQMRAAGLEQVRWRRLMLGSVAIHWGRRPVAPAGRT
jgi:demethylmenaquinone methyltransferase/2-methoxy-6-polyprenyl-1,4-benzoquinol methylase